MAETADPADPVGFRGGDVLFPNLVAPSDGAGPFADISWTRGDAGSSFAAWENFANATGPNEPGIRETITTIPSLGGPIELVRGIPGTALPILPSEGEASVSFVPLGGDAIVTSTRNLYTGGGPGRFELLADGENLGGGYDTQIVLQVGSLGSMQDTDSFLLEFTDPHGETVSLEPVFAGPLAEAGDSGSDMGGVSEQSAAVWTIPRFNPEGFTLSYAVPGNLSSSTLILDVLAQPSVPGDYTGDRLVNESDFAAFQSEFGTAGFRSDGNLDWVVNAADYTVLRDSIVAPAAAAFVTAVPEPSSGGCLLIALVVATCPPRRGARGSANPRTGDLS